LFTTTQRLLGSSMEYALLSNVGVGVGVGVGVDEGVGEAVWVPPPAIGVRVGAQAVDEPTTTSASAITERIRPDFDTLPSVTLPFVLPGSFRRDFKGCKFAVCASFELEVSCLQIRRRFRNHRLERRQSETRAA
jgi:hypothetical protein